VLACWESIALNGRPVYICFDSDVTTKPEVAEALRRLKKFLESKGATVTVITLPAGPGGAKVGLDDFFAAGHGVEELLASRSAPAVLEEDEPDVDAAKLAATDPATKHATAALRAAAPARSKRGPTTAVSDGEVLTAIRGVLQATPFHGEGYRTCSLEATVSLPGDRGDGLRS
jgi:hypothetical protein